VNILHITLLGSVFHRIALHFISSLVLYRLVVQCSIVCWAFWLQVQ